MSQTGPGPGPGKTEIEDNVLMSSEKGQEQQQSETEAQNALGDDDIRGSQNNADADTDKGNFVLTTCRAARLEEDNAELRQRLSEVARKVSAICDSSHDGDNVSNNEYDLHKRLREVLRECSDNNGLLATTQRPSYKTAQLQVKVELEQERRLRIQAALEDAEKRSFASNRTVERKEAEIDELKARLARLEASYEVKLKLTDAEKERLERLIRQKETEIRETEIKSKELSSKAEEFEDMFHNQLELVQSLQADLNVAYEENKTLVKEMELLNEMFGEMERTHIKEALKGYQSPEPDLSDATHKDAKGKVVALGELLKVISEEGSSSVQDSCFKEVSTKNGTRMVLSVSKTFMKLKDLILEKKTLEDQVEKMKSINDKLNSKMGTHEAKLFNITDELNKTWNYVSTLKLQHQRLHTSEQILRAELLEKRQILAKLREELEYSRQSWNLVKQKTADSEREWRALRDEFAARRQEALGQSSSESGFSDNQTEDEASSESPPILSEDVGLFPAAQEEVTTREIQQDAPHLSQQVPAQIVEEKEDSDGQQQVSARIVEEKENTSVQEEKKEQAEHHSLETSQVFIPPLSYLTEVPPELQPNLMDPNPKEEPRDYQEIYDRLIESTTRSAQLASRLAEMNHAMGQEEEEATVSTATTTDEDEEDVEPRSEEEDDDNLDNESPDIVTDDDDDDSSEATEEIHPHDEDDDDDDSDVSLEAPLPEGFILDHFPSSISDDEEMDAYSDEDTEEDLSSPMLTPVSSPDPVVWDGEQQLQQEQAEQFAQGLAEDHPQEEVQEHEEHAEQDGAAAALPIPPPPPPPPMPPPTFSLRPTVASTSVRPAYLDDLDALIDDDDDNNDVEDPEEESENATAVTRLLIKHLPKQMAKLRNDKVEMEEKIQDLEDRLSQQALAMSEMERRGEMQRREAERAKNSCSDLQKKLEVAVALREANATTAKLPSSAKSQEAKSSSPLPSNDTVQGQQQQFQPSNSSPSLLIPISLAHLSDCSVCWIFRSVPLTSVFASVESRTSDSSSESVELISNQRIPSDRDHWPYVIQVSSNDCGPFLLLSLKTNGRLEDIDFSIEMKAGESR